jgi:hypothetical protein
MRGIGRMTDKGPCAVLGLMGKPLTTMLACCGVLIGAAGSPASVTLPGAKEVEPKESGLDGFRKQPDGSWKIVRYIAYEAP